MASQLFRKNTCNPDSYRRPVHHGPRKRNSQWPAAVNQQRGLTRCGRCDILFGDEDDSMRVPGKTHCLACEKQLRAGHFLIEVEPSTGHHPLAFIDTSGYGITTCVDCGNEITRGKRCRKCGYAARWREKQTA